VRAEPVGRLAPEIENAAYFCRLEALQNAAKHAGPGARAAIELQLCDGRLEFSVADDGTGFDAGAPYGYGLTNLRDRLAALGGELDVDSLPGGGVTVRGRLPVE
jgi:signal transduction histidine kinase